MERNYRTIKIRMVDETDEQSYFYNFLSSHWSKNIWRSERKSFKAICNQIDKQIDSGRQVADSGGMLIPAPKEVQ